MEWGANPKALTYVYKLNESGKIESADYSDPIPEELRSTSNNSDVIVTYDVSDKNEVSKPWAYQGLNVYTLTVTDRRDEKKLATMTFAYDRSKGHACGANERNAIDIQAFIRTATSTKDHKHVEPIVQDVTLEVVDDKKIDPEIVINKDEWDTQYKIIFASNADNCSKLAKEGYRNSNSLVLEKDEKSRLIDFSQADHICRTEAIWTGDYYYKFKDLKHYTLIKYSQTGDLFYKVRFEKPTEKLYYTGILQVQTLKSENGYVTFDWESSMIDSPSDALHKVIHINHRRTLRFKEPAALGNP
jgi:hypothetical protein